jgi:hypothetical protein
VSSSANPVFEARSSFGNDFDEKTIGLMAWRQVTLVTRVSPEPHYVMGRRIAEEEIRGCGGSGNKREEKNDQDHGRCDVQTVTFKPPRKLVSFSKTGIAKRMYEPAGDVGLLTQFTGPGVRSPARLDDGLTAVRVRALKGDSLSVLAERRCKCQRPAPLASGMQVQNERYAIVLKRLVQ